MENEALKELNIQYLIKEKCELKIKLTPFKSPVTTEKGEKFLGENPEISAHLIPSLIEDN